LRVFLLDALHEALRQVACWRDEGHELTVAVNLSMRNLLDSRLPDQVSDALATWSLPVAVLFGPFSMALRARCCLNGAMSAVLRAGRRQEAAS